MSADAKVAVVIAAYNCAEYIGQAVESVLSQTHRQIEIIVVDDGSTDGTANALEQFPEVRYIRQENSGPSAARNRAIRSTDADYIAFIDSDDLWEPGKLAAQIELIREDDGLGLVHTGVEFFHKDYTFPAVSAKRIVTDPPDELVDLLFSNHIITSSVLMRRSCLERAGLFDESFLLCEDWDLWLRVARHFKIGRIPKVLTRYRFHSSNMCRKIRLLYLYKEQVITKFRHTCGADDRLKNYCLLALANIHFLYGSPFKYREGSALRTYSALVRLYNKNNLLLQAVREALGNAITLRCPRFPDSLRLVKRWFGQ